MKSKRVMKNRIIISFLLGIIVFFVLFMQTTIKLDNVNENIQIDNEKTPKKSDYWVFGFIHIDDNWTDAVLAGYCKGTGSWGDPFRLENITIDATGSPTGDGILIENSVNYYFIIRNCTLYNSGFDNNYDAGIYLLNSNNGTLENNNCSFNNRKGILMQFSHNNTISNNIVFNNTQIGIKLSGSHNNTISGNTVSNTINYDGLNIEYSDYNVLSGNSLNNNKQDGINMGDSDDNEILDNTISNNKNGISLTYGGDDNEFYDNIIQGNNEYGVLIRNISNECDDNLFYNNHFNNPKGINAWDNGTNTQWDNGVIGNYWHDYDGKDKDDDLIGDTPYNIQGTGGGIDRFPICDDGPESDDDEAPKGILGYNLLFFIGTMCMISIITMILIKKRLEQANL